MTTQIGWIDFSEKDRKKALDVIHLLQEPGAVDELGIGIVRDAFANYFFPGTSTVQTRAKYFFIIPYIMKEVCANPQITSIEKITRKVDEEEYYCAQKMGDNDGVIGRDVLPKWVVRKPSNIYWNGLKKLGIFTYPKLSIAEYYREELQRRMLHSKDSGNRSGEENEQDDENATATGLRSFWNLPPEYAENISWRDSLTIDLLPWEAKWLRKCITENLGGSLFKYIVDKNIDIESISRKNDAFWALSEVIRDDIGRETKEIINLANQFNSLVYLCRILYNKILSSDNNVRANELWNSEQRRLDDVKKLDIDTLAGKLGVKNVGVISFLNDMKVALVKEEWEKARSRIINREVEIKDKTRAKLKRKAEFSDQAWIGGHLLDYRFCSAARLIMDIYKAEKEASNV